MNEEENAVTVLCVNRMFPDVTAFTECNKVTDVKLINGIH